MAYTLSNLQDRSEAYLKLLNDEQGSNRLGDIGLAISAAAPGLLSEDYGQAAAAYGETLGGRLDAERAADRELTLAAKQLAIGDMQKAEEKQALRQSSAGRIFQFPNAALSRRISGVFSNLIARESPEQAHALLVERKDGSFLVGVRAPIAKPYGADTLCLKFSGGGRVAAAGINQLAPQDVERFFGAFEEQF